MSYLLAFAGFAALIVLHEFGHFVVAKAVGMRVERFALFFPPLLVRTRRGETEYGIGAIPLGGYVRITGMNPREEIPPEVAHRAYYRQPVWKRIAVIAAGPGMNVLIAFAILFVLYSAHGTREPTSRVDRVDRGQPATGVLRPGDRILSVDGRRGGPETFSRQIARHHCPGTPRPGCAATTPVRLVILRDGRRRALRLTPRFDASPKIRRVRLGFSFEVLDRDAPPSRAASLAGSDMWAVAKGTVSAVARLFDAERRREITGVVGGYETTRQAVAFDSVDALYVLAIISLGLAIVNLFPFLPLDGGHIFWALAEKVRGRAIPFSVMERAGAIGFVLVLMLFLVGLTNDIDRLRGEGFRINR